MTRLERLYDEIEADSIEVIDTHFSDSKKGACLYDEDCYKAITLDRGAMSSRSEERIVLQEEKSHYDTDSLYFIEATANTPNARSNRIWAEGRARAHQRKKLIPFDEMSEVFGKFVYADGLDIYEMAEHFEVTPEYAQQAIEYYHQQGERW